MEPALRLHTCWGVRALALPQIGLAFYSSWLREAGELLGIITLRIFNMDGIHTGLKHGVETRGLKYWLKHRVWWVGVSNRPVGM